MLMSYSYELYKMRRTYTPKYRDIKIRELVQLVKEKGIYISVWEDFYYTAFKVGFLKHKPGRPPHNSKARKHRRKLVLDEKLFNEWVAKNTVVVPFGYRRMSEFIEEFGHDKYYFYKIIRYGKKIGIIVDKFRVGSKVYYNDEQLRRLLLDYKFGDKQV